VALTLSGNRRHDLPPNGGPTDWLEAAEVRRAEIRRREALLACRSLSAARWSADVAQSSAPSDHEPWLLRHLVFGGDCRPSGVGEHFNCRVCWLTFELRGRKRHGAWPAKRMMTASASRAKCHAGGGPWLERRVRPHLQLEASP